MAAGGGRKPNQAAGGPVWNSGENVVAAPGGALTSGRATPCDMRGSSAGSGATVIAGKGGSTAGISAWAAAGALVLSETSTVAALKADPGRRSSGDGVGATAWAATTNSSKKAIAIRHIAPKFARAPVMPEDYSMPAALSAGTIVL